MNVVHVVFDINTFGITQKSLKMLRDTLANAIANRIAVVEVPTNDLCCGYFIFDQKRQAAIFTGDGFRTDRAGEGGAGYESAEALFKLYGINPIPWDPINIEEIYTLPEEKIEKLLLKLARKIAGKLSEEEFYRPIDQNPQYVQ